MAATPKSHTAANHGRGDELQYCCECRRRRCRLDHPDKRRCWICKRGNLIRITSHQIADWFYAGHAQGLRGQPMLSWIREGLKRRPCAYCQQTFAPTAMDFHHIYAFSKRGAVSSLKMIDQVCELVHCVVLCACCHRVEEFERRRGLNVVLPVGTSHALPAQSSPPSTALADTGVPLIYSPPR